eukprot:5944800-Pyramimonas_sp.AAC.1
MPAQRPAGLDLSESSSFVIQVPAGPQRLPSTAQFGLRLATQAWIQSANARRRLACRCRAASQPAAAALNVGRH